MDATRKDQSARDYLRALEEEKVYVKQATVLHCLVLVPCLPFSFSFRWLEETLQLLVAPAPELSEALRNGVVYAKLAKFFDKSSSTQAARIYDENEEIYKVCQFRIFLCTLLLSTVSGSVLLC
jgi:hypothetical protein